jgi:gas vesicle protein
MNVAISSTAMPSTQETMEKLIFLSRPVSTESKNAKANNKSVVIKAKTEQRGRAKKWTKPDGKPKRPLSAYNLFFRDQRTLLLGADKPSQEMEDFKKRAHCKTHGKISFSDMAKLIGIRWKSLDEYTRKIYAARAQMDMQRYTTEVGIWKKQSQQQQQQLQQQHQQQQQQHQYPLAKATIASASQPKCHVVVAKDYGVMHPFQCPSSSSDNFSVGYLGYSQGRQIDHQLQQPQRPMMEIPEALVWSQPFLPRWSYPTVEKVSTANSRMLNHFHQQHQWEQQQNDRARWALVSADLHRLRVISAQMNSKLAFLEGGQL